MNDEKMFTATFSANGCHTCASRVECSGFCCKQGETHYFDPETLQKNGQFIKIWILSSYDDKQKCGYHAVKSLYEFDCSDSKARSITMLLYPDKKASNAVIGAHHEESQDWFGFASNSIFQYIAEIICIN